MLNRIIIFLILVSHTNCKLHYIYLENGNYNCDSIKAKFIASTFTCSKKLLISGRVLQSIGLEEKENYTFANYGEEYNDSDIAAYPNKRLIFTGIRNDSNLGFIFYEQGGLAINHNLLLYEIAGKKVYFTHYSVNDKYETIDSLKVGIREEVCF